MSEEAWAHHLIGPIWIEKWPSLGYKQELPTFFM